MQRRIQRRINYRARFRLAAGLPHICIFRPAYVYPLEPRKEPNFSYRLLRKIYPAVRLLLPNQVIQADDLAQAMVDAVVSETGRAAARFSRTATSGPCSQLIPE